MASLSERMKQARESDEAAAEEEDQPDDDTGESDAQDEPQAPQPQPTEAQIDKVFSAAHKSAEKHIAKIAPLVGAQPDQVVACPCCDFPGYVFAQRPPLEGDRLLAVKAVTGEEDVRAYKRDPNAVQCEACDGHGKLVRPTKVGDQLLAICTTCNGYGWHSPAQQPPQYPQPEQSVYYPAPPHNGPPQYPQPVYPGQQSG